MKVLLISQYFFPEQFKCNDVAFELSRRGYDVTVLTGIPNYPQGKYFRGYGLFRKRVEMIDGVRIIRSFQFPRGSGSGTRLVLNYFSWAFSASFRAVFLCLHNSYDVVLVHETSPVTVGIPAVFLRKLFKIPFHFWVLDLWPESLTAAGGIRNDLVLSFFRRLTCWIYDHSARILMSSRSFRDSICEKGPYDDKLVYFPNWSDSSLSQSVPYVLPSLPTGFIVMFAGNIGEAQDLEHLLLAAESLRDSRDIHFVFVGDGRKRAWLEEYVKIHQLSETVHWVGRHPLSSMPSFFRSADVLLVSLKDEPVFNLTAPAKLQAYMQSGKPILGMLNGEGHSLIVDSGCGFAVSAGDSAGLSSQIKHLSLTDACELRSMGERGRHYCSLHFNLSKCMDHLCSLLEETKTDTAYARNK